MCLIPSQFRKVRSFPFAIADKINSSRNQAGDIFIGTVDPSVLVDSHVVIPRGTEAHLQMVEDKKGAVFMEMQKWKWS